MERSRANERNVYADKVEEGNFIPQNVIGTDVSINSCNFTESVLYYFIYLS